VWIFLGICSALFLGFHEIFKKVGVNHNTVLPVLFFASLAGAVFFLPFIGISLFIDEPAGKVLWYIQEVPLRAHVLFVLKSVIVAFAWLFGYYAVKHLPVTILAPINASGPVWTILGAMIIYGEKLNFLQWCGVVISLIFYYIISFGGNIRAHVANAKKWSLYAFLSILFNSASALLDKYLVIHYDRIAMQAYFSLYTAIIFGFILFFTTQKNHPLFRTFIWRWAIPLIGLFLIAADYFYFYALSFEGSLVSILIILRRSSAVIVFTAGILYFHESNLRRRALTLAGILLGTALVVLGS
jgi:bacterial/archaeal transporter family protein